MPYFGEELTKAEYDRRYVDGNEDSLAEYVIVDGAGRYIDGACLRTLPVLANTAVSKREKTENVTTGTVRYLTSVLTGTNAKFTVRTASHDWHGMRIPQNSAWFVATKNIRDGDQLLVYYGDDYRIYTTPGYQVGTTKRQAVKPAPSKR